MFIVTPAYGLKECDCICAQKELFMFILLFATYLYFLLAWHNFAMPGLMLTFGLDNGSASAKHLFVYVYHSQNLHCYAK